MARLLARSFTVLAREQPEAHARLCQQLGGLALELRVDGERFAAGFSAEGAWVQDVEGNEPVRVATRGGAILDLLDARLTLADAVLSDAVEVVGPVDILVRLHEGLGVYLHGAVRSPGFAGLLQRLRDTCAASA